MATQQKATPFDGETLYAEDLALMLSSIVRAGIVGGVEGNLEAYGDSSGMQVKVRPGRLWIGNTLGQSALRRLFRYYKDLGGDPDVTLPIGANSSGSTRIDRVIVRLNLSATPKAQLMILPGTPAASPVPPELTRNASTYDISLAQVTVGSGVVTITAGNVIDERENQAVCGFSNRSSQLLLGNDRAHVSHRALGIQRMAGQVGALVFVYDENGALLTRMNPTGQWESAPGVPDAGQAFVRGLSGQAGGDQIIGGRVEFAVRRTALPTITAQGLTVIRDGETANDTTGATLSMTSQFGGFRWLLTRASTTRIRAVDFDWSV